MKTHWTAKLASDLFTKRVIDPNSQTEQEIATDAGYARSHMSRLIREKVESGKLEKVFKMVSGRAIPSYRIKK